MTDEPPRRKLNVDNTDHTLSLTSDMHVQQAIRKLTPNEPIYRANSPPIRDLVYAMENLLRMQEDRLRKQVSSDIRNLEARLSPPAPANVVINLRVIPDAADRARSLKLVKKLDLAIHLVHDPGVDDWHAHLIEGLILPTIAELTELLNSESDQPEDLSRKRAHGLALISSLLSWARGLAITIGAIGALDDAASNIKSAARKAKKLINACAEAGWVWELLLRLFHEARF